MLAETMPMDWIAKPKFRPMEAGSSNSRTSTGKPTVPPPMGVEPATYDPTAMDKAIGQCELTVDQ